VGEREECLEILADLVAARTENPPGNESAAAVVVAQWFERYGISYHTYEKAPGRGNIIGSIGSGSPVVLVASHLDTVPAGSGWDSDPFSLRVEGDRAYGRGACDNKAAMAGSLIAAKRLTARGRSPGGTVLIAGIADEERGNGFGASYLLEEVGLKADYAIIPDSSSHMAELGIAEKGVVWATVRSHGKAAHGSRPHLGRNAIVQMARLIGILQSSPLPSPPHEGFTPATMNIGRISGGTVPNAVPETCEVEIDFRILPGTTEEDVYSFIDGCIARTTATDPEASFSVERRPWMPPHDVPLDSRIVHAAQEASRRVFGREMKLLYQGGVTLAKEFNRAGMPAVALGPGSPEAAHTANEWMEIDEMLSFADFVVAVVDVLAGR
jgi:succinyl-diaminopimelate desuccinylase